MPPTLASILFATGILFLLRRTSHSGPKPSVGLWVPTIWIGIMLSRPVSYWLSAEGGAEVDLEAYLDGNAVERSVLTFLMIAGLVVLLKRRVRWSSVVADSAVVWCFYGYALLSVAWSPYPLVTTKRVVRELGSVMMILIILTDTNRLEAVKRVFLRCAAVLIPLSVLFIKYYPAIGRYTHRWSYQTMYSGVTTNKNSLGVLAMVCGLFLVWHVADVANGSTRWRRMASVWPELCVLLACVWILWIANSATSSVCFVLGLVLFGVARRWMAGAGVRTVAGAIVAVALVGWVLLWVSDLRGLVAESVGRSATLTERTDIWAAVLALPTNPAFGAGFSSVWLTREGWALRADIGGLAHAHNGYLEIYANGGAVGVALLLGLLLQSAVQAGRHVAHRTPAGPIFFAVVASGMVYNLTEVTFANGNAIGLLLWLIAMSNPGSTEATQPMSRRSKVADDPSRTLDPVRKRRGSTRRSGSIARCGSNRQNLGTWRLGEWSTP